MKKVLSILLLTALLATLCACAPETPQTPTQTTAAPDCVHQYTETVTKKATCAEEGEKTFTCGKCEHKYVEPIAKTEHIYMDADCETAKTCVNCNATQGRPKGHTYVQGVCQYCQGDQPDYKAMGTGTWETMGLTFSEEELEVIQLRFEDGQSLLRADFWGLLSELSEKKQEEYLKDPDSLLEFKRDQYYYKGFGESCPVSFEEEEDTVTMIVTDGETYGIIEMIRKGPDSYEITEVGGFIIDDIVTSSLEVGMIFKVVE